MRGEVHDDVASRRPGKPLLDFRSVAVTSDAVSMNPFGHFAKQAALFGCAAGAADPRFGVNNDIVRIDLASFDQRH